MTFGEKYITHLRVLENVGMTSIKPILYQGVEIVPLQFLKAVLPPPETLGENYTGKTSIGCQIRGIDKNGEIKNYFIYNNCDHAETYKEVKGQAVSYTTGVPAMIGAMMVLQGKWSGAGVFNVEEFNPDPFMEMLNVHGLPWREVHNAELPHEYGK
jgi:saccharopine dehydrogenase (NAD+, L-lysine-forming)